jgi:threonine/homoserine/homoserine lactone efflux protein
LDGMPDLAHWTIFLGAAFILLITPGPSIMYVVARGIAQGCRAAVLSSVGLALGDLLQVIATAVGLAALLGSAPKLFVALKLVGALYLVCLGAATLLGKGGRVVDSATEPGSRQADSSKWLILQGLLALNPKTALFFLAFLPQFIAADAGPVRIQVLLFGTAFVVMGLATNSLFGCSGGRLVALAGSGGKLRTAMRYAGGSVLIALGIVAAFTPSPQAVVCCAR